MNPLTKEDPARIHPSAVVSPEAVLESGVEIGAYSVIGPQVRVGRGTKVFSHVHIEGDTEIGRDCQIFPGAVLGTYGQAKGAASVRSQLRIGSENIIREYVTVHTSMKDGQATVIGDRNMLMANAHVAHDCRLGNDITMANLVTLGGHVAVEDGAVIGGLTGIHQFVRVGRLAMIGGMSKIVKDVAPFSMVDGRPASFFGVNAVGLRRAGFSLEKRLRIKKVLKALLGSGANLSKQLVKVQKEFKSDPDIATIISFLQTSKRGVTSHDDALSVADNE